MVVAMTPHPRYQYKPEDLFQTDSSGHSIRLHRRLAQTLSEATTTATCPEGELQRTLNHCNRR